MEKVLAIDRTAVDILSEMVVNYITTHPAEEEPEAAPVLDNAA